MEREDIQRLIDEVALSTGASVDSGSITPEDGIELQYCEPARSLMDRIRTAAAALFTASLPAYVLAQDPNVKHIGEIGSAVGMGTYMLLLHLEHIAAAVRKPERE